MGVQTENTKQLEALLKPHQLELDVLKEAYQEVAKEDAEKKKVAIKELIRKGMSLQAQMDQVERDFLASKKKHDKELGKTLNKLRGLAHGKTMQEVAAEEEEKEGPGTDIART